MGIGIWAVADKIYISDVVGNSLFKSAAILMVINGVFLILLSFLGCIGAISRRKVVVIIVCMKILVYLGLLIYLGLLMRIWIFYNLYHSLYPSLYIIHPGIFASFLFKMHKFRK